MKTILTLSLLLASFISEAQCFNDEIVPDLFVVSDDTPTIRLQQESGNYDFQEWDIAGNEVAFFIREITSNNEEKFMFTISADAPAYSLRIDSSEGNVGVGLGFRDDGLPRKAEARLHVNGDVLVEGGTIDGTVKGIKAGIVSSNDFDVAGRGSNVVFGSSYPAGTEYAVSLTIMTTNDEKVMAAYMTNQFNESGFEIKLVGGTAEDIDAVHWRAQPVYS